MQGKGKQNDINFHQSSPIASFYQMTPTYPRSKRPHVPSSLTPINVTPNSVTATPTTTVIPSRYSISAITAHVATVTNNGSETYRLDGILEIIDMGSPPSATAALISLNEKHYNSISRAQGYLQQEVVVAGSPNTVSAI